MEIACLDLEGVLIPEIWIAFAEAAGIPELRATTRDIPDYDQLMRQRLDLLARHGLGLREIQEVIATLSPLAGAAEFLDWLRERFQVLILSDTFYEFAQPLMRQLGYPTLFCHRLVVDEGGRVTGYRLRQPTMLAQADAGILFSAPANVVAEFPQFPAVATYDELKAAFIAASERELAP